MLTPSSPQALAEVAGNAAYYSAQNLHAIEMYDGALQEALSTGDDDGALRCRFWKGAALLSMGRLRHALGTLGENIVNLEQGGDPKLLYSSMLVYADIAVQLPLALPKIDRVLATVTAFLRDTGHMRWRDMLLTIVSRKHAARGEFAAARNAAEESRSVWRRDDTPFLTADSVYGTLVHACLCLKDYFSAQLHLERWAKESDEQPQHREVTIHIYYAYLALDTGRHQDALYYARRAEQAASYYDTAAERWGTLDCMILALLNQSSFDSSDLDLRRLLKMYSGARRSESATDLYSFHMKRFYYWLARSQHVQGAYHSSLSRAERSLRAAELIARRMDCLLECSIRIDEVTSCARLMSGPRTDASA